MLGFRVYRDPIYCWGYINSTLALYVHSAYKSRVERIRMRLLVEAYVTVLLVSAYALLIQDVVQQQTWTYLANTG